VFIRTVHKHTPQVTAEAASLVPVDRQEGVSGPEDEVVVEVNNCGCTDMTVKIMSSVNCGFFIVFWVIAIFAFGSRNTLGSWAFIWLGIICLLVAIVGLFLLCCACCKPPKGADE
jgi:hypothetical protein